MIAGQRWLTRSGAVVEIVERRDTGLTKYDRMGVHSRAILLICRFVQYAGAEPLTDEPPRQFALHEDGYYCGHKDHALDLVMMVQQVAA